MKQVCEVIFRAVCLGFSACMLVLSLLTSIRAAAVRDSAARLRREIEALETENAVLRARYESSISLEEIERYATEILGMQRCTAGQVVYIETKDMGA